jgi:hypothetical protein
MAVYAHEVELRKVGLTQRGINVNTPQGQAQLAQEKQLLLDGMIDDLLIAQEAAKQGVAVSDAEVEAALQEISKPSAAGRVRAAAGKERSNIGRCAHLAAHPNAQQQDARSGRRDDSSG